MRARRAICGVARLKDLNQKMKVKSLKTLGICPNPQGDTGVPLTPYVLPQRNYYAYKNTNRANARFKMGTSHAAASAKHSAGRGERFPSRGSGPRPEVFIF